jgi:hypothetical protein
MRRLVVRNADRLPSLRVYTSGPSDPSAVGLSPPYGEHPSSSGIPGTPRESASLTDWRLLALSGTVVMSIHGWGRRRRP